MDAWREVMLMATSLLLAAVPAVNAVRLGPTIVGSGGGFVAGNSKRVGLMLWRGVRWACVGGPFRDPSSA